MSAGIRSTWQKCVLLLFIFYNCQPSQSYSPSKWQISYTNENHLSSLSIFPGYLYKDSAVTMSISCTSAHEDLELQVRWILIEINCEENLYENFNLELLNFYDAFTNLTSPELANQTTGKLANPEEVQVVKYQVSQGQIITCSKNLIIKLQDESELPYIKTTLHFDRQMNQSHPLFSKKIDRSGPKSFINKDHLVTSPWEKGMYHFIPILTPITIPQKYDASVTIELKGIHGYLSAIDWPSYPLSGVIAFLYLGISTGWILIWARQHKHTFRVHVILGVIAVTGSLSNTMLFMNLGIRNSGGYESPVLSWLAVILSAAQSTAFFAVLMAVSTGYGLSRPTMNRCQVGGIIVISCFLAIGILSAQFFPAQLRSKWWAIAPAIVNLIALLSIGIWLIGFTIHTLVGLCQRRYTQKIVTFSIFTFVCFLTFIGYIVVLGLVLHNSGLTNVCGKEWEVAWVMPAFTHVISIVQLLVLMWLWRPADPFHSYAFTPLMNTGDEEEEDEEEKREWTKVALEPL